MSSFTDEVMGWTKSLAAQEHLVLLETVYIVEMATNKCKWHETVYLLSLSTVEYFAKENIHRTSTQRENALQVN